MSNIKSSIVTAAAAVLFLSGSAFAATAFAAPATGEQPYFNGVVASSQLQRSAVESEAAASLPAAGQFNAKSTAQQPASTLTRAEVEASIHTMPAAGEAA